MLNKRFAPGWLPHAKRLPILALLKVVQNNDNKANKLKLSVSAWQSLQLSFLIFCPRLSIWKALKWPLLSALFFKEITFQRKWWCIVWHFNYANTLFNLFYFFTFCSFSFGSPSQLSVHCRQKKQQKQGKCAWRTLRQLLLNGPILLCTSKWRAKSVIILCFLSAVSIIWSSLSWDLRCQPDLESGCERV